MSEEQTNGTVITFGTFDVLHVGHIRVLERAAQLGNRLVVGVSSDALNFSKKQRMPVFSQDERMEIIGSLRVVDEVFLEESLELKREYIVAHGEDLPEIRNWLWRGTGTMASDRDSEGTGS